MRMEEIEKRVNESKEALQKVGLEGKFNIGLMLDDLQFLINEVKRLEEIIEDAENYNKHLKLHSKYRLNEGHLRKMKIILEGRNENHIPKIE